MSPALDIAFRSSLVLLAALTAAGVLRRQSASQRHLVLAVGGAAALAVAPLVWFGPGWTWSVPVGTPPSLIETVVESGATPHPPEPARDWLLVVWLGGAAAAGGRLLWRLARLGAITRRAHRVDGPWTRLLPDAARTMGVRRPVAVHAASSGLVTGSWGWRRPVILVPAGADRWDDARVRLVLLHELAHARRVDWAVQLGAELLCALYWFNPLAALLATHLRREGERACDDLVLHTGITADRYGSELLAIARLQPEPVITAPLVSMAHQSTLEGRIAAMLDHTLDRRPSTPRAAAALLCGALALVAPFATLRLLAQDEARSLTIQVFDPSGGVLPGVSIEIEGGQDAKRSALTEGSGRAVFPDVAPGEYTLRASLAGFRTLSAPLPVQGRRDRQRSITLQVAELQETVSVRERRRPPAAAQTKVVSPEPVRVGGNIKVPRKLNHVAPEYPETMLDAGLEGIVPMEALIGKDGSVVSVRVLSADVHPEFARAAEAAVRRWQFSPTLLNGDAVEVRMAVSVRFSLQD